MKSLLPTFSTGNIRPTSYLRTPTWNVRPSKEIKLVKIPIKVVIPLQEVPKPVLPPLVKIGPVVPVQ